MLALVGMLVVAGGVLGSVALFKSAETAVDSAAVASESRFAQASGPAEALVAATNVTLDSSPMISRLSRNGREISVTQIDHARGVSFSEQTGGPTAGSTFYLNSDEMMIRFGEDLTLPGVDGDAWYRLSTDNPLFGMIGQTIAMTTDRASQREMMNVYAAVEDRGPVTFEGQSLTRLVAVVDAEKFLEYSLKFANAFGGDELGLSEDDLRDAIAPQTPSTVEYWIDDRGRIIKQVTGDQVVVNSNFGEPLDIPEIAAADIEEFPFN